MYNGVNQTITEVSKRWINTFHARCDEYFFTPLEVWNNNPMWRRVLLFSYERQIKFLDTDKKPQSTSWRSRIRIGFFLQVVERSRLDHNLALGYVLSLQKSTAVDTLKKLQAAAGHHYKRVRVKYLVFLYWIFSVESFKFEMSLCTFFHFFSSSSH